jgi:hypothetical protein
MGFSGQIKSELIQFKSSEAAKLSIISSFKAQSSMNTDMSDSCQAEKTIPFPPVFSGLYFISKVISSGEIL